MTFAVGVVLFAVGIAISVALHECGHMWAAQATGMKVRRYFVGFGPKIFSYRRGETEYGLKALPLGGFCDIAGMTALDELEPDEVDRAMYKQKTWKRIFVMIAGIAMNFLLGFVLIVLTAVAWGLPDLRSIPDTQLGQLACVAPPNADGAPGACTGDGPAQRAGLRSGDIVTAVGGVPVDTWEKFVYETQKQTGPFTYRVTRDGKPLEVTVTPERVQRTVVGKDGKAAHNADGSVKKAEVSAIGAARYFPPDRQYGFLAAIPASATFTGELLQRTAESLLHIPSKVGALWTAVTGGARDADTPISVVGASRIGGETAERGLWNQFVLLLASLNFFLGAFNLLPLLPLDGGHMAVAWFEKLRNLLRRRQGLPEAAPVDYLKLMPVTYVAVVIGGLFMLLTLTADIINPIRLY
ncbi:MAG: site-2 protease family protein [Mycobacteriaceae bacterium]|nr:site-2 protease family protein [Mycobacteriaceae bacterium]